MLGILSVLQGHALCMDCSNYTHCFTQLKSKHKHLSVFNTKFISNLR